MAEVVATRQFPNHDEGKTFEEDVITTKYLNESDVKKRLFLKLKKLRKRQNIKLLGLIKMIHSFTPKMEGLLLMRSIQKTPH